ncbi:MAG TPA: excisionase family DNA-binding protein [Armatimonadota bacterium]|nr:excisionase family DNA-binding protein [Armatimonadota bacterium]
MNGVPPSPWLTVAQAAKYIGCGPKLVYREISAKRIRAAAIGGRRTYRIKLEWVDAYLEARAEPVEVTPLRRVG